MKSKYGAKPQRVDGYYFHSRLEADYYTKLKLEKRGGLIKDFKKQVPFDLWAWSPDKGKIRMKSRHYVDFLVDLNDGTQEVREVKGFRTRDWEMKRQLFEANYPDLPYRVNPGKVTWKDVVDEL